MTFWDAVSELPMASAIFFAIALLLAFAFEFMNGFHDTANAVTTVIYTRTLPATPAVIYSGFMNFLGVLLGGTGVAFGIVNLLPVDLLIQSNAENARLGLAMVVSLLIAGVIWNLGTWYLGLPVSSSHTLIGSILGVGLANSILTGQDGVNWNKATEVGLGLIISPVIGFIAAAGLLLAMKLLVRDRRLYVPPEGDEKPPKWIRGVLIATCGGVSFAHGSNDGQKGMGLILLVLIGFLSGHYALDTYDGRKVQPARDGALAVKGRLESAGKLTPELAADADEIARALEGKASFAEVPSSERKTIRERLFRLSNAARDPAFAEDRTDEWKREKKSLTNAVEFVPLWVVIGVALALGFGTMIGYKRIVITIAEKIGKTHLTYAQGAAAEMVAAATIMAADFAHLPVSTTQVLSSGIAGTMAANRSGIQAATCRRILLAWIFTLPGTILLSGTLFLIGSKLVR
jgi:phosphate/sulfate permease